MPPAQRCGLCPRRSFYRSLGSHRTLDPHDLLGAPDPRKSSSDVESLLTATLKRLGVTFTGVGMCSFHVRECLLHKISPVQLSGKDAREKPSLGQPTFTDDVAPRHFVVHFCRCGHTRFTVLKRDQHLIVNKVLVKWAITPYRPSPT
ncbi:hypothetical protein RRG08_067157 [Elysia crispata]|uniref:Uncharacterized protein n=1 Tax=Elysia crispata TaxID=231223 RepID=A0AAE0YPH0_9GAST|nr:hypothetical protein RRG08_067157 [Elysia crispata]